MKTKSDLPATTEHTLNPSISSQKPQLLGIDLTRSLPSLRIVGYGLLLLWLLDLLALFYPLQPLDPVWGFQTLGQLVERVGVLFIALGLVLLGDIQRRQKWEIAGLQIIVRGILLMAIIYLSLIPLGIGNTVRIARLTSQQLQAEAQTQISNLTQYHSAIAASQEISDVRQFIERLGGETQNNSSSLVNLKQRANRLFKAQVKEIRAQATQNSSARKSNLIKRSLKWNIGALISGCLLLLLWSGNSWLTKVKSSK
ncbi:MAG: HpsJ family protein [Cyanobacteria bacterium J06623_7]